MLPLNSNYHGAIANPRWASLEPGILTALLIWLRACITRSLATFALLRPTDDRSGDADLPPLRIRVEPGKRRPDLPGYAMAQGGDSR